MLVDRSRTKRANVIYNSLQQHFIVMKSKPKQHVSSFITPVSITTIENRKVLIHLSEWNAEDGSVTVTLTTSFFNFISQHKHHCCTLRILHTPLRLHHHWPSPGREPLGQWIHHCPPSGADSTHSSSSSSGLNQNYIILF